MQQVLGEVTAVLMARDPAHGPVKTRLRAGGLGEAAVAEIATILLRCTAQRLRRAAGRLVLAVTPGDGVELARRLGVDDAETVAQGRGDLGQRLDRVWREIVPDGPVAFFGGDSPDVPETSLLAIPRELRRCDVALGPTPDGGYWTLAARARRPSLLDRIDWGSGLVYHQTRLRAEKAGLLVATLPPWPDIDRPQDVHALRTRLRILADPGGPRTDETAPLRWMAGELDRLFSGDPPRHGRP